MTTNYPIDEITRNQVADSLVCLADQSEWSPEAWQRCHQLVQANCENELLQYVYDDLFHYSAVLHSLLGPDEGVLEGYRQEFRDIATALRVGLSLTEARQKYEL